MTVSLIEGESEADGDSTTDQQSVISLNFAGVDASLDESELTLLLMVVQTLILLIWLQSEVRR